MGVSSFKSLIKDLISFLPGGSTAEWRKTDQCDPQKPTVILVSGFAVNHRTLSVIRRRLIRDGYNVVVLSMDWQAFSEGIGGLRYMAKKLFSLVLHVRKSVGMARKDVFLVAHSAGGLVARYYVQFLGGDHYCNGLITLGTPHQGTWMPVLGMFTHLLLKLHCLIQMLPHSRFLKSLNTGEFPNNFPMVCISSPSDFMCPRGSASLPKVLAEKPNVTRLEVERISHSRFVLSGRCYRVLKAFLSDPKKVQQSTPSLSVR